MSSSPSKQTWTVTDWYVNEHCGLGEGPYYEKDTNSLRFVDIKKDKLYTVRLDQDPPVAKPLDMQPGEGQLARIAVTADVEGLDPQETLLIGAKFGLALLDRRSGKLDYITKFSSEDNPILRANDGAVDPHGRFWLGTMKDFEKEDGSLKPEPIGSLFLFDDAKPAQRKNKNDDEDDQILIPNSISWSPDGKTMYFTESTKRMIYKYTYSADDNAISDRKPFYEHASAGVPDGHRVDVDGNVWSAFYGGSNVLKISPDGEVLGEIKLPTKNITCTEFVGTELFITTASMEEDEGTAEEIAHSGALYKVDVGVQGLPHYKFKLNKQ